MEANGDVSHQHFTTTENCEALARHLASTHQIFSRVLSPSSPLFFPESAYVPTPLTAAPPLLWVPVSPSQAFALIDKKHLPNNKGLITSSHMPTYLVAMSVGLSESSHRVLVPPALHEMAFNEPRRLIEYIEMLRSNGKEIFNLVAQANEFSGFRPWRIQ